ncbi:hypothetical protein Tco_1339529 [Tanacetum coccineum]
MEDGSKYRLSFMLDKKELTLTLNDFKTIFQLPQATDNNHERFVAAPKFSEMVLFFLNDLGFTQELRSPSKFKTTGLVRYCFINNVHVDYADLLWEGLHYSLEHLSTLIPYLGFTKIIKSLDELEAKQNVEKVKEHLIVEEIEKFVEGTKNVENVEVDNSISHGQNDPGTWLEPRSNKESPEVEITIDVSQPVNVIEEEDESAKDDYELRRREKGRR